MVHRTQNEDKQNNKNTTQYVLDTTMRKHSNNVNMAGALTQTTGGNDEPNIVYMRKAEIVTDITTRN